MFNNMVHSPSHGRHVARVIAGLMSILMLTLTVSAQAGWTAWIYNPQTGGITQVRQDGQVVGEILLPLSQAFNAYGADVMVSPSGRYIAYSALDTTTGNRNVQLFVYDLQTASLRYSYDLNNTALTSFEVAPDATAFDEANGQFAFGVALQGGGWSVVVGEFTGGGTFAELTSDAAAGVIPQDAPVLPVVQSYDGEWVSFTAYFTDSPDLPMYGAYRWNIGTGELAEDVAYVTVNGDTLPPTGSVAMPLRNEGFVSADSITGANTVAIYDATTNQRITLHDGEGLRFTEATFVRGGEQVLVQAVNPVDESMSLRVINRDGSVAGELIGTLGDITGTPDGFVGMFDSGGAPALAHVNTTTDPFQPVTVWTGTTGSDEHVVFVMGDGQPQTAFESWVGLE